MEQQTKTYQHNLRVHVPPLIRDKAGQIAQARHRGFLCGKRPSRIARTSLGDAFPCLAPQCKSLALRSFGSSIAVSVVCEKGREGRRRKRNTAVSYKLLHSSFCMEFQKIGANVINCRKWNCSSVEVSALMVSALILTSVSSLPSDSY